jgi:exopolysaccharide biosynthesis polyprenyl glycosylphosphotransferase
LKTPGDSALRKIIYILDGIIVVLAFFMAYLLHDAWGDVIPWFKSPPQIQDYIAMGVFALPLWLILMPIFRLQLVFEENRSLWETALQLAKHHFVGLVILTMVMFATQVVVNRGLVALFMVCTFTMMYLERFILGTRQRHNWRRGHSRSRIILVGSPGKTMTRFVEMMKAQSLPPQFIGRVTSPGDDEDGVSDDSILPPVIGEIAEIEQLLHDRHPDQVLFFKPFDSLAAANEALRICEVVGVSGRLAIDMTQPGRAIPRVVTLSEQPFITFDMLPPYPEFRAIKHGFDAVAAMLGLVLLSPLFVLVGFAVVVTMGRPVFFLQERAGMFGRRFRMIKFRTMVPGAEKKRDELLDRNEMSGPVFKVSDDPRVTRLGRLLRQTSIDELPQLINVLHGTMSLIGPRPLPVSEQQNIYGWHRRRLSMKPGISGLWQVSGRNDIDFEEWMKLDLKYIDEWSLLLDAKILLKTIPAVIAKRGAA